MTSPSLTPNTAARAAPDWTLRWWCSDVLVLLCVRCRQQHRRQGASLPCSGCSSLEAPGSPANWLTARSQYRGHRYEVEQTMRQHPGSQTPGQFCRITEDDADKEQSEHDRDIAGCRFRFTGMCKTEKYRL